MDYRYLKVFMDAAQSLNFAQTATRLSIAPSAVSRQIQLFEESVGESLFIRTNRKIILTEKGREILSLVQPLDKWSQKNKRMVLRIAGLTAALDRFFWPVVLKENLSAEYDFDIIDAVSGIAIKMLESQRVDIAIVNKKEKSNLISYFPLGSEEFVLISKKPVALKDIHKHTWIYGESGDVLRKLSEVKTEPPFIRSNSIFQIYDLVEKGAGIAVVPVTPLLKKQKVSMLPVPMTAKPIYLALPNFEMIPPRLKKIYQLISQ